VPGFASSSSRSLASVSNSTRSSITARFRSRRSATEALAESHQTWALDRAAGVWRVDLFREPSDGDTWLARRDESIRLPYDQLIERTPDGIPYSCPEATILFKAKHTREKDDADLAAVLPLLGSERRRWLAKALELVHPGHRWLDELR